MSDIVGRRSLVNRSILYVIISYIIYTQCAEPYAHSEHIKVQVFEGNYEIAEPFRGAERFVCPGR